MEKENIKLNEKSFDNSVDTLTKNSFENVEKNEKDNDDAILFKDFLDELDELVDDLKDDLDDTTVRTNNNEPLTIKEEAIHSNNEMKENEETSKKDNLEGDANILSLKDIEKLLKDGNDELPYLKQVDNEQESEDNKKNDFQTWVDRTNKLSEKSANDNLDPSTTSLDEIFTVRNYVKSRQEEYVENVKTKKDLTEEQKDELLSKNYLDKLNRDEKKELLHIEKMAQKDQKEKREEEAKLNQDEINKKTEESEFNFDFIEEKNNKKTKRISLFTKLKDKISGKKLIGGYSKKYLILLITVLTLFFVGVILLLNNIFGWIPSLFF